MNRICGIEALYIAAVVGALAANATAIAFLMHNRPWSAAACIAIMFFAGRIIILTDRPPTAAAERAPE